MIKVFGTGKNHSKNLIDSILSFNKTSTWTLSSGAGSAVCSTEDSFDGLQSLKLNNTDLSTLFIATNSIQSTVINKTGDYGFVISVKKNHPLEVIDLKVNIYKNATLEYSDGFSIGSATDSSLDDNNIWVRYMVDDILKLSATDVITFTFEQEVRTSALTETTVYVDGLHLYAMDSVDTLPPLYSEPIYNKTLQDITDEGATTTNNITVANLNLSGISTYADDTAAGTGGLTTGQLYQTSTGELRIKL